jgi:hypothetical protein
VEAVALVASLRHRSVPEQYAWRTVGALNLEELRRRVAEAERVAATFRSDDDGPLPPAPGGDEEEKLAWYTRLTPYQRLVLLLAAIDLLIGAIAALGPGGGAAESNQEVSVEVKQEVSVEVNQEISVTLTK